MFGLFKSPEEKLLSKMKKDIKNMAFNNLRRSGFTNTTIEGTILINLIEEAKIYYLNRVILLGRDYNLHVDKVTMIIISASKSVIKENIKL